MQFSIKRTYASFSKACKDLWCLFPKFFVSFIFVALIIIGKFEIEQLRSYSLIAPVANLLIVVDQYGQSVLELCLANNDLKRYEKVTIIDISNLIETYEESPLSQNNTDVGIKPKRHLHTPREELRSVIQAIANLQPKAIGVDVDFSEDTASKNPHYKDLREKSDLPFLEFAAKPLLPVYSSQSKPVSLVLGVFRQKTQTPENWLGPGFEELAGSVDLGLLKGQFPDPTLVQLWIRSKDGERNLLSFGAKLGKHISDRVRPEDTDDSWWREQVEYYDDRDTGDHVAFFTLRTAYLDRIDNERVVRGFSLESLRDNADKITGKVVLLGKVDEAVDKFPMWGVRNEPFAGIVLHACAALTFDEGFPYRLTFWGRIFFDFAASAVVLIFATWICLICKGTDFHLMQMQVTFIAIFLVAIMAGLLANKSDTLWTDYWIVITALLLHHPIQHLFMSLCKFFFSRH